MHHIRFLKSPTLKSGRFGVQLNAKVTITTDLGDSFLYFDLPILVILVDNAGQHAQAHPYQWKSGKRELEISFSVPLAAVLAGQRSRWPCKLLVQPRDAIYRLDALAGMLVPLVQGVRVGLVLPVLSEDLIAETVVHKASGESNMGTWPDPDDTPPSFSVQVVPKRVARNIRMADGDAFFIWEETGESIARHIWDAGLLLSAYLDSYSPLAESLGLAYPDYLKTLLSKDKFSVLELGTGCGIVGITMAKHFPKSEVLITDMFEAEEIAGYNISTLARCARPDGSFVKLAYQNLDWEKSLPDNIHERDLDLILVADCTYNSDVVPYLVKTLADLVDFNQKAVILVAMKIRHSSEVIFFELMKQKSLIALETLVFPLPLLGQEAEDIELHFFKRS